jgi:hypothetical protein
MKTISVILGCLLILGCSNPINTSTENLSDFTDNGKTYYTVTFMNGNTVYETQAVEAGQKATKPAVDPTFSGCEFVSWDWITNPINQDTIIKARYLYYKWEITEGTFVSDNTFKEYETHPGDIGWPLLTMRIFYLFIPSNDPYYSQSNYRMEQIILALKDYSKNSYNTTPVVYRALNDNDISSTLIDSVRVEPGIEFEFSNIGKYHEDGHGIYSFLFNYNEDTPLTGYKWIVIKKAGFKTDYLE